jgi:predicted transcriptional regulator
MSLFRFSIGVRPETRAKLEQLAESEKRTIAAMARVLIEEAIATREQVQ